MAKRIMREFNLNEISGVDSPAQKGARALIMKRDTTTDLYIAKRNGEADLLPAVEEYLKREFSGDRRKELADSGAALPDGSFPIENRGDLENAIRAIGRAKDPAKAKSHIIARARALDASSLLPDDWKAGKSIGGDLVIELSRQAPRVLPELLENVVKVEEIEAEVAKIVDKKKRAGVRKSIGDAMAAIISSTWAVLDDTSSGDKASLLQKNFAEFKDHVLGLVPGAADTTTQRTEKAETDSMKAIAKALGLPETATEAEIVKALETRDATAKADALLAKMSGKHKSFMDNGGKMPSGGKDAFAGMSPAERDAHCSSNPIADTDAEKAAKAAAELAKAAGDEHILVDGKPIYKRDVGNDGTWAVFKSQQAQIEKAATTEATRTIEKRIEPLKLIIGKAEDIAGVIHRITIGKSTPKDAEAIETLLKAGNEQLVKSDGVMREFGKAGSGSFGKAADGINAAAVELRKANPKWSIEKARVEARNANPDLAKEEQAEQEAARKAA